MTITTRNLIGWIAASIVAVHPLAAQPHYGGTWKQIPVPALSFIQDFGFKDSLNGIARDNSGIEITIDGGHTWSLDTSFVILGTKTCLNSVEATGAGRGVIFAQAGPNEKTTVISPGNSFQISPPEGGDGLFGTYIPIAQHMLDSMNGYRLVQQQNSNQGIIDSVVFLVTHDAWQNSAEYGGGYGGFGAQNPNFINSQNFFGGLLLDSSELWTANVNVILHTTNAGLSWDSTVPIDTVKYKTQWKDFFANAATREIYAENQFSSIDFAYSNDYGETWRLDSTFGESLWRMSVPKSGIIWGMLGKGIAPITITPALGQVSNKIVYSSDTGHTWFVDSVTFASDSLVEMHFLDAKHGWIAGFSNNQSLIWYYDADQSIVKTNSSTNGRVNTPYLIVVPNPAENFIEIPEGSFELKIFDMLGRPIPCAEGNGVVDISLLPSGMYFVSNDYVFGKFVKE